MNGKQRWIVLLVMYGVFLAIAIAAILAVLGLVPGADPDFRKFAVAVLFADILAVCVAVFKTQFSGGGSLHLNVAFNGTPPPTSWNLEKSEYFILDEGGVQKDKGKVLLRRCPGGWSCLLPVRTEATDLARLLLVDGAGITWEVELFSPNTLDRVAHKKEGQP
mgnify:CR=1 FL=1